MSLHEYFILEAPRAKMPGVTYCTQQSTTRLLCCSNSTNVAQIPAMRAANKVFLAPELLLFLKEALFGLVSLCAHVLNFTFSASPQKHAEKIKLVETAQPESSLHYLSRITKATLHFFMNSSLSTALIVQG